MSLPIAPEDGAVLLTHTAGVQQILGNNDNSDRTSPEAHLPLKGRARYEATYMGLGGANRNSPKESPRDRQQLTQPSSNFGCQGTFLILGLSRKSSLPTPEPLIPGCLSR